MDNKEHTCKRCGIKASTKGSLVRHLQNKTPCCALQQEIDRKLLLQELSSKEYKTHTIICEYCSKTVSKPVYARHKKTCKANKKVEKEPLHVSQKEFQELKARVVELTQQLAAQQRTEQPATRLIEDRTFLDVIANKTINMVIKHFQQHTTSKTLDMENNDISNQDLNKTQALIKKKKVKPIKRMAVWQKYIGLSQGESLCLCCKSNKINTFTFHCGHVKSEAEGGTIELSNLRPICSVCNSSMGTMNMKDFAKEEFGVDIE